MKKLLFACCLVALLVGCGKKDVKERVKNLDEVSGEWTKAQTDEAIDLYIEGLERQEALMEENMEVLRQTDFFRKSKCDRATLDKRAEEIAAAEKRVDEKRATLLEEK